MMVDIDEYDNLNMNTDLNLKVNINMIADLIMTGKRNVNFDKMYELT